MCVKSDVQNMRFVLHEAKNCPRCKVNITRSSGCAQMMCVSCHCIFDWTSGTEVTSGAVHNPHFHELSEEARTKVMNARAARGLGATDEERFVAGVGAAGAAGAAGADEFDPLCEEFESYRVENRTTQLFPVDPSLLRILMRAPATTPLPFSRQALPLRLKSPTRSRPAATEY